MWRGRFSSALSKQLYFLHRGGEHQRPGSRSGIGVFFQPSVGSVETAAGFASPGRSLRIERPSGGSSRRARSGTRCTARPRSTGAAGSAPPPSARGSTTVSAIVRPRRARKKSAKLFCFFSPAGHADPGAPRGARRRPRPAIAPGPRSRRGAARRSVARRRPPGIRPERGPVAPIIPSVCFANRSRARRLTRPPHPPRRTLPLAAAEQMQEAARMLTNLQTEGDGVDLATLLRESPREAYSFQQLGVRSRLPPPALSPPRSLRPSAAKIDRSRVVPSSSPAAPPPRACRPPPPPGDGTPHR